MSDNKQILRSRAFRALAQDDRPYRRLLEKKEGRKMDGAFDFPSLSYREASKSVILRAEGAKDLLFGFAQGTTNG